jgi:hypothetical protein
MSVKPTIRSRDLAALVRLHRIRERLRALRHAPELEHPEVIRRTTLDTARRASLHQAGAAPMTPSGITVGSPTIGSPSLITMRKGDMHKAFIRWREQRYNSEHRGIAFELSLADWLSIWIGSGHYRQRGRCRGDFVMSRPGDKGSYSVRNVAIVPVEANIVEGAGHPCAPSTRAKIAKRLKGNKNGVGHRHNAASRKKMSKAARARAQEGSTWLANVRAVTSSPAYRRKMSRAIKASWAVRRKKNAGPEASR